MDGRGANSSDSLNIYYVSLLFDSTDCNAPSQNGKIKCHPKDQYFCIDKSFAGDGILNCPPPFCTDEPNIPCGRQTQQPVRPVHTHAKSKNGASASALNSLITFVFVITSAIFILN